MKNNDVLVTGIGLVTSLGEGAEANWKSLSAGGSATVDSARFAPFSIHPLPPIDWGLQIPKRGDQRQMETWQRLGTYTAGLALEDAGIKGDEALCSTMDMVVAAGGGERDEAVDAMILAAAGDRAADLEILLNEKLTTELRPTLFLAQLSNLLAGNISIVHKVTGSSRTFMGEESAGVAAIETAAARIRSGQATHVLVGGAFQTEHPDMLLGYELGGYLHRGAHAPVWSRGKSPGGGIVSGSASAFLVLEQRGHAEARGRKAYARLEAVASSRAARGYGFAEELAALLRSLGTSDKAPLVLSAASGAHAATAAERRAIEALGGTARGFATLVGHAKEAQFFIAVALAALALSHGEAYPPFDNADEKPFEGELREAVATGVGYHRFEGAARLASEG
jgi:3-oxoacyl-[acyl-carrier-protein] synthase II